MEYCKAVIEGDVFKTEIIEGRPRRVYLDQGINSITPVTLAKELPLPKKGESVAYVGNMSMYNGKRKTIMQFWANELRSK